MGPEDGQSHEREKGKHKSSPNYYTDSGFENQETDASSWKK